MADEAGLKTSSHYTDELSAHLLCASQQPVYLEKHAFAARPLPGGAAGRGRRPRAADGGAGDRDALQRRRRSSPTG